MAVCALLFSSSAVSIFTLLSAGVDSRASGASHTAPRALCGCVCGLWHSRADAWDRSRGGKNEKVFIRLLEGRLAGVRLDDSLLHPTKYGPVSIRGLA